MTFAAIIIIYIIVGWFAFLGMNKIETRYFKELDKCCENGVNCYIDKKHYIHINRYGKFYYVLMLILVITIWAFWPIVVTTCGIANYVNYKQVMKEYKEFRLL